MRSSKKNMLLRGLAVIAVAASLLVGCDNSSPTEPKLVASVVGAWTGTYNGISSQCDSSAQASFQYTDGGFLGGTLTAPCLGSLYVGDGNLQGNTFTANILNADLGLNPLKGTLSGSSLEITMFIEIGGAPARPTGQLHLHR